MRKLSVLWVAMLLAVPSGTLLAAELPFGNLVGLLGGTHVDMHLPQSSNQCSHEGCIERVPITECVTAKKEVFDVKKCYEYVTIPETKYRFVTRCVVKEVKCPYCMPYCEAQDVPRCYESETWESTGGGGCGGCGQVHCKRCQNKIENVVCQQCGRKHGQFSHSIISF